VLAGQPGWDDVTVQPGSVGEPDDKADLRRRVLVRRRVLPAAERTRVGTLLAEVVRPLAEGIDTVAAYVSMPSEPDTAPLLAALAGTRVLLPVLRPDNDLDWAQASPAALVPGRRGLVEPAGPRLGRDAVAACGLVVVPALAVDRQGNRLGRGGGSYDRALRRATGLVVALLHDGELLDAVPADPHDVPVGAAALPSHGVVRLPAAALGRCSP
jgi:5-formyltetrahydrofolate cyclo-ligase